MYKFSEFSNKKQVQISLTFKFSMLYNALESRFHSGKGICKQELRNVANEWCYIKLILSFMSKI